MFFYLHFILSAKGGTFINQLAFIHLQQAEKSIRFYQRIDVDDRTSIDTEIERLKRQIGDDDSNTRKSLKWSELWKLVTRNPGKKAMIIGTVLSLLTHFCGNFALMNFTANIFELSGSVLQPDQSALVVAVVQFVATCTVPYLIERAGRKPLYIISTIGSTVGLSVLGSYVMLESWHYHVQSFRWIPVVSLSATVSIQALAASTLVMPFMAEILPENLREFGLSFCNTILGVSAFITLKFTPSLIESIGLYGTLFLFGGCCLLSTLFIIFYGIPEPKGKNYNEIMKLLE